PRKVYLNFRNNLATLIKHLPWPRLLVTLPVRLILDLLASINFLTQGKARNALAVVKGYLHVIGWIPTLVRKRRALRQRIQQMSVAPPDDTGWLNISLLVQYYVLARRTFAAITGSGHVTKTEVRDHQQ
ncbi:MAG: hypothetical protein R3330_16875, partial [Saprospiraceae bacterium]|nr:hypothetical protein [Saprospiraceae bacterium]